ncbi:MAG: hypothetical protein HeimC3_08660 [Candidatus Heimdallarchaeota archaeon LC_3]|nr:MAG: hypothetical protein HeimC3_08660 [Candidatus Heimdallarchaeota archaeon LC_3]
MNVMFFKKNKYLSITFLVLITIIIVFLLSTVVLADDDDFFGEETRLFPLVKEDLAKELGM